MPFLEPDEWAHFRSVMEAFSESGSIPEVFEFAFYSFRIAASFDTKN